MPITVRELRDRLSSEPDDALVYADPNPTSTDVWNVIGVESARTGAIVLLTDEGI